MSVGGSASSGSGGSLPEAPLHSYRTIALRLKQKRFLRKPNLGQAIASFDQLYRKIRRDAYDSPHLYTAFCLMAVARCEQATYNVEKSVAAFCQAGFIYWENEQEAFNMKYLGLGECSAQAEDCYILAIRTLLQEGKHQMAGGLYVEMATMLEQLGDYTAASGYYRRAAALQRSVSPMQTVTLNISALTCDIERRDYEQVTETIQVILDLCSEESAPNPHDFDVSVMNPMSSDTSHSFFTHHREQCTVLFVLVELVRANYDHAAELIRSLKLPSVPAQVPNGAGEPLPLASLVGGESEFCVLLEDLMCAVEDVDVEAVSALRNRIGRRCSLLQVRVLDRIMSDVAFAHRKTNVEHTLAC